MEDQYIQASVQTPNTTYVPNSGYTYIPTTVSSTGQSNNKALLFFAIGGLSCGVLFLVGVIMLCGFTLALLQSVSEPGDTSDLSESSYYSGFTLNERTVGILNQPDEYSSNPNDKIAVINVEGPIYYTPDPNVEGTNNYTIAVQLEKAGKDQSVKAIVLKFNTPGGDVLAAEPMCRKIKSIDQRKPVIAFMDGMGASLGYLLANCTRAIYARPDTITGSIGVIYEDIDVTGIFTNLGAKHIVITNSEGTQKANMDLDDPQSESYKILQSMLDETYEYFVQTVLDGRQRAGSKITEQDLRRYADGRIFTGRQAERNGLVDHLGEYDDVLDKVADKYLGGMSVTVVEYDIKIDILHSIFNRSSKLLADLHAFMMHPRQSKLLFIMH